MVVSGEKVQLAVMVPADLYEQLNEACIALGMSRSKLTRVALNYAFQIGIERCLYESTSVDARFTFALSADLYQKLKELAVSQGTSKTTIVRSALVCFLQVLKPYMGKFVEVNEVKVPAWAIEVLSTIAAAEGRTTDELIARAIVYYAKKYAMKLGLNIAELNKALSAQEPQS